MSAFSRRAAGSGVGVKVGVGDGIGVLVGAGVAVAEGVRVATGVDTDGKVSEQLCKINARNRMDGRNRVFTQVLYWRLGYMSTLENFSR
jgi:hypothetical protein